jgi:aryl-alcohol dehydrogenase-like predicted oxidoreductase
MRTIRFGRCGELVSAVALGTWAHGGPRRQGPLDVGWGGHDDAEATAALERAYTAGITHWDTADAYGDGRSERLIGAVWGAVDRQRIFLATKVGWLEGPYEGYYDPRQIRAQLERSLVNLRTDHVDLYYLHHCDFGPDDARLDDAVALLRGFRDAGKIRFIGLSDWSVEKIRRLCPRVDPDVVQPYRNVMDDAYRGSELAAWVEERDLGVAFFSPLKHGLLLGKYDEPPRFEPGDMRRRVAGFGDRATLARLAANRALLEERIDHPQPVLHALVGSLLEDSPSGSVLLGQRRPAQVDSAATLGAPLDTATATWVRRLYAQQ